MCNCWRSISSRRHGKYFKLWVYYLLQMERTSLFIWFYLQDGSLDLYACDDDEGKRMQLFISTKPCPYQSIPTKVISRFEDASGEARTSLASPSQRLVFLIFLIHYAFYLSTCSWWCFCLFVYFSLAIFQLLSWIYHQRVKDLISPFVCDLWNSTEYKLTCLGLLLSDPPFVIVKLPLPSNLHILLLSFSTDLKLEWNLYFLDPVILFPFGSLTHPINGILPCFFYLFTLLLFPFLSMMPRVSVLFLHYNERNSFVSFCISSLKRLQLSAKGIRIVNLSSSPRP